MSTSILVRPWRTTDASALLAVDRSAADLGRQSATPIATLEEAERELVSRPSLARDRADAAVEVAGRVGPSCRP